MTKMQDLEETAMAWLVKRDHPDFSDEQQAALEAWIAENVMHRVAFMRASDAWRCTVRFRQMRPVNAEVDHDLLLDDAHYPRPLMPARPYTPPEPRPRSKPKSVLHAALIPTIAAAILGFSAIGWYATDQVRWEHYSTSVGGKEEFPLPDGTHVVLNTDSDLRVRITESSRELRLVRGEAMVKAARDDKRPFRLVAGNTVIQATEANFDVRLGARGTTVVIVSTGRVATEIEDGYFRNPFSREPPAQSVISAGYTASIGPHEIQAAPLDTEEHERKTAWLTDALSFRGETITEAAAEFNRYNRRKIVVVDPLIAGRRVGGVFKDTDPESFVAALRIIANVKATTIGGEEGPGYGTIRLSRMPEPH